jgi:hypothetical protein
MTGAIALAIVLVIAVAGISMAMESQQNTQSPGTRRPSRATPPASRSARDRLRERPWERKGPAAEASSQAPPPEPGEAELKGPELLRSGTSTEAKVISVVDERTIGPVTRSRLGLQIQPDEGPAFEVTVRVAFQTPTSRARVKVGGTIPVRYDKDDRTRVVVDLPPEQ